MSAQPAVVVAAFEPFGGRARNRSWETVRRLTGRPETEIVQLPVHFARLRELVPALVARTPRALLLVGESPRKLVAVEQVALNVMASKRPDNAGVKASGQELIVAGPVALRASWDAVALARRLREAGVPAEPSFHAGTYACNAALYLALHASAPETRVGFLHVPHGRWPRGVRLEKLVRAVELAAQALQGHR